MNWHLSNSTLLAIAVAVLVAMALGRNIVGRRPKTGADDPDRGNEGPETRRDDNAW